ncbi:MAG TPA: 4-hydroxy-3-methylbut-2-enyl diphosphate reductase [Armatimonadota bacterium]|jgi:4-hydroxy-3-methylbut-2-enyl diphosphate reductase
MEIILAAEAGFCFGVRRALEMAEAATGEHDRVFSLGPLIHNPQVVERLAQQGLVVCDQLEEIPTGAVAMIRAHGTGPAIYPEAEQRGITLIDATCPFVSRVHEKAAHFSEQGYQVLVLGDPNHPEAQGIVAHTGGAARIVEGARDLEGLRLSPRVAVVCQTTQTPEALRELVDALLPRVAEVVVANTICDATAKRQEASLSLAHEVDVIIVIGGYHSANTRRLTEICGATGTPTYHIESAGELREEWVAGARRVGVTAGASTPAEAISEVLARLEEIAAQTETAPGPDKETA